MKDELKSMAHNDVWDLMEGCKRVGVNGSLRLNVTLKEISNVTRLESYGNIERYSKGWHLL